MLARVVGNKGEVVRRANEQAAAARQFDLTVPDTAKNRTTGQPPRRVAISVPPIPGKGITCRILMRLLPAR
jgi:hypothetical protein